MQGQLQPPVLVFVQSKQRAKELFAELIYDGINVDVIHSDRPQVQRDRVVQAFRSGQIWVLICTELLARGLDFQGVGLVLNYDLPPSAISYVHRVGESEMTLLLVHSYSLLSWKSGSVTVNCLLPT